MRKTFKYRIYPTKSQITKLNNQIELSRWVYNKTLEMRKDAYETEHKSLSLYDTNKFLKVWSNGEKPELKEVYSQILQNAQLRVDLAFKSFFKRVKAGMTPGYPRFKGHDRYDSITFKQTGFRLHEDGAYLSKTGRVPITLHRPIEGTIKTCTVQKTSTDKWYISFSCEIEKPKPLHRTNKVVGIDVGLKTFVQISDGRSVKNPRFFKESQAKLAKYQRKFSKAKKGTEKRYKQRKIVAKIHERIKNKRTDFCHKTAHSLVKDYDLIAFEDLSIKKMLEQKKFSKSIADASWGQLLDILTHKAEEAGKIVTAVSPKNTTQQCSRCMAIVPKTLKDRVHICPHCGLSIDRDLNASINILRLGLESVERPSQRFTAVALERALGSPRL